MKPGIHKVNRSLFLLCAAWWAVLTYVAAQGHPFIQYTTADGLPTNYVYGVVEDEDGFIWAYTENGLAKFDGYTFHHYTTEDGLSGNDVVYARRARDGKIWLYTYAGKPSYLYRDSIRIVHESRGKFHDIRDGEALYSLRDRYFYFPSGEAYEYQIDDRLYTAFPHLFRRAQTIPKGAYLDNEQSYGYYSRLLTQDSVIYFAPTAEYVSHFFDRRGLAGLLHINADRHRLYWCDSTARCDSLVYRSFTSRGEHQIFQLSAPHSYVISSGIAKFDIVDLAEKTVRHYDVSPYVGDKLQHMVLSVLPTGLIVTTDRAVLQYDLWQDRTRVTNIRHLGARYTILRAYEDRRKNLWVATREAGLFLLPHAYRRVTKRFVNKDEFTTHFERLLSTPNGQVLAITTDANVYQILPDTILPIWKPKVRQRFREAVATPLGVLISTNLRGYVIPADKQRLAVIAADQFFRKSVECSESELHTPEAITTSFWCNMPYLAYDPKQDHLYALTPWRIFIRYAIGDDRKLHCWYSYKNAGGVIHYDTYRAVLLAGVEEGVAEWNGINYGPLVTDERLRNVSSLLATKDALWIGSESSGLFRYDFKADTLSRIVETPMVRRIHPAEDGYLYIAGNDGILRIDPNPPFRRQRFTPRNGLPTNEVEDVYSLNDSVLYVASLAGIHELNPLLRDLENNLSGALRLTKVSVNDQTRAVAELNALPHHANYLEFAYSLHDYASDGDITYFTRLRPLDTDWRTGTSRSVRYPALPPGEYFFDLKAKDCRGNETQLDPITVTIRKPFWRTHVFSLLLTALTLGLLAYLYRRREKVRRRKHRTAKELNRRIAQLELSALRAQMNPHFVFNALGAIQYYIQTQEVEAADKYLTKFAQLMRRYLDTSREKMIPLHREIELLDIYTELEQLRFEGLFTTTISVEDQLQPEDHFIPTMLIQPYVENAINHGLSLRKDGKGELLISFAYANRRLRCVVADNGIGRSQARVQRASGHKSQGMQLIREKIDTLRKAGLSDISVTITDHRPEDATYPGTRVEITIKNPDHDED